MGNPTYIIAYFFAELVIFNSCVIRAISFISYICKQKFCMMSLTERQRC